MRVDKPVNSVARFGHELRRFRERAGLTQAQLAGRLGYDHTYISKLESGDRLPRIDFASQADDVLHAGGGLVAVASSVLAGRRVRGGVDVTRGPVLTLLPGAAASRFAPPPLLPPRNGRLPTFGVTCPLHGGDQCAAESWDFGAVQAFAAGHRGRIGEEVVHGLITLLRTFIDANMRRTAADVVPSVEQASRVAVGLTPQARGRVAVGLMQIAARYADLAGWLRVERGQYGIGMVWLQRAVEWGQSSGNTAAVCEALGRMSTVARLEGDGVTALAYAEAAAAIEPARRWSVVLAELHAARAHAHLGNRREFEARVGKAQRWAERLGERDLMEAPWLFGAEGEAYIASHLSGGLRDIADATGDAALAARAVASAETSLAHIPSRMHPSRLLLTLRLADAYACQGDLAAAATVAAPVMAEAASVKTAVIGRELGRLRARLGTRADEIG